MTESNAICECGGQKYQYQGRWWCKDCRRRDVTVRENARKINFPWPPDEVPDGLDEFLALCVSPELQAARENASIRSAPTPTNGNVLPSGNGIRRQEPIIWLQTQEALGIWLAEAIKKKQIEVEDTPTKALTDALKHFRIRNKSGGTKEPNAESVKSAVRGKDILEKQS